MDRAFRLPAAEDDLWHRVVEHLLKQRDVAMADAERHLHVLEELAFQQQFAGRPITRGRFLEVATQLASRLKLSHEGDKAERWWREVNDWELLLTSTDRGDEEACDFPIAGMGEFFAARHLTGRWARAETWFRFRWARWAGLLCRAQLPPFRALMRRTEHEAVLLLMVGLVNDPIRESALLHAVPESNRRFRALARSRCIHASVVARFLFAVRLLVLWTPIALKRFNPSRFERYERHVRPEAGLRALKTVRAADNVLPLIEYVQGVLREHATQPRAQVEHAMDCAVWLGDAKLVPDLIELLAGKYVWAADRALVQLGAVAVQPLIAALREGPERLRMRALEVLGWIGDPRALEPLVAALQSNPEAIRMRAAEALGRIRDPRAVEPLIAALGDGDQYVRSYAAEALGEIRDPRAVEPLIQALEADDEGVRVDAVVALHQLGDLRAVKPLLALLKDGSIHVRRAAGAALDELCTHSQALTYEDTILRDHRG